MNECSRRSASSSSATTAAVAVLARDPLRRPVQPEHYRVGSTRRGRVSVRAAAFCCPAVGQSSTTREYELRAPVQGHEVQFSLITTFLLHNVVHLSVRQFFIRYQSCEYDIFKTNEPISLQIGLSGLRGKE